MQSHSFARRVHTDAERKRRYGTYRWKQLRLQVLRRDHYVCRVVPGCVRRATVADHVNPVYPGMSDAEFHDPANLRAACGPHNLWRGLDQREAERQGGGTRMLRGQSSLKA